LLGRDKSHTGIHVLFNFPLINFLRHHGQIFLGIDPLPFFRASQAKCLNAIAFPAKNLDGIRQIIFPLTIILADFVKG